MEYFFYKVSDIPYGHESLDLLDVHERARYEQQGLSFLRSRLMLKHTLAARTQLAMRDISLSYRAHGKPYLACAPQLHFNIAHSGDMLAIALDRHPIGIDIERMRPRALQRVAARIMTRAAYDSYIAGGEQLEDFYTYWCSCEAIIKQQGASIWMAEQYPFAIIDGGITLGFPSTSRVELLRPSPHYMAAIAYQSPLGS